MQISTLKSLADQQALEKKPTKIIQDKERLFLLCNIVKNYPKLLRSASPWQLSQDLLQLFDALFFQSITLPSNQAAMQELLSKAYQVDKQKYAALDFEANIIITLWQAWQAELHERKLIDEKTLFALQLAEHIKQVNKTQHWYILFLNDALNTLEIEWLTKLADSSNVHLISTDINKVKTNKGHFLKQALYPEQLADNTIKPLDDNSLGLLPCHSFENEAQQVLLQLRYFHSIKQAHERIILLCEDRSLVRRLRALLEQHKISLIDPFGWSLITTRAATFANAIIECAEQNYPHTALLELMKSPFCTNVIELHSVYRFENDIVRSENIHNDINRYKRALNKRSQRLGAWTQEEKKKIETSLDAIEKACSKLQALIKRRNSDATIFTEALLDSIQHLQAKEILENDAAGKVLLEILKQMQQTAMCYPNALSFSDYKTWLLREFNDSYLVSQEQSDDISLVNLKQSQGFSADYLVIANASRSKLPNVKNQLQFFNQRVCHELGLPTYQDNLLFHKNWFFELVSRSKQCIISWQAEKNGEPQLCSPWVASIRNLHIKQFKQALPNRYNSIKDPKDSITFIPKQHKPSVTNYKPLLPKDISVSAHQTLVDCPYEFFVSRLLGLKSTDDIKDKLQKNDYGSLIHQAIQAFHTDVSFLPGPFTLPLNSNNRSNAIELLGDISKKLFASHINDNYQDNSWLQNWLLFIPTFIDWEIAEYAHWRHKDSEVSLSKDITETMSLSGKIDRIDQAVDDSSAMRLLDYKTGVLPSNTAIQCGENIQLTSYSLFLEHVNQVRYIGLNEQGKVHDKRYLENEALQDLRAKTLARLETMLKQLHEGHPIPIWVDNEKCQSCQVASICRIKVWPDQDNV